MGTRAARGLVIAVAALLFLAVGAGVFAALRPGPQPKAGSPEARVRDYVTALYESDPATAAAQLDPDGPCDEADLRDIFLDGEARVVLRESATDGDTARVRVDLVHAGGGPLGGGENREPATFDLRRVGDRWVITGEPWPTFACGTTKEDR
ncbi:hypothetical protein LL946_16165 [Knoellia locipacati]|uniref:hypothetical protein n=1 Tax=Knoellia locipacati TaxID=882824 RepID=UPI00384CB1E4